MILKKFRMYLWDGLKGILIIVLTPLVICLLPFAVVTWIVEQELL